MLGILIVALCVVARSTPEPGEEDMDLALRTRIAIDSVAWQPVSGGWILFGRDEDDEDPVPTSWRIYKVRPDGTGLSPVSPTPLSNPIWAPDGTKLACVEDTPNDGDGLWVVDIHGNRLYSLGQHPGFLGFAGWSLDGSKIAFTTRRGDGGPYVAVMTSPGEELRFLSEG